MLAVVTPEHSSSASLVNATGTRIVRLTISVDNTVDKVLFARVILRCNLSDDNLPLFWALRLRSHRPQNVVGLTICLRN